MNRRGEADDAFVLLAEEQGDLRLAVGRMERASWGRLRKRVEEGQREGLERGGRC